MAKAAWIEIIDDEEATGKVRRLYEQVAAARGGNSNIARAASLWPDLLEVQEREYELFNGPGTELGADIKDLIAALVSQLNNCDYCSNLYRGALRSRHWSDEKVTHILQDIESDHLNERDRAIMVFADKITRRPQAMDSGDIAALRAVGLNDKSILEAAAITSHFNYLTRLAAALGVMTEGDGPGS